MKSGSILLSLHDQSRGMTLRTVPQEVHLGLWIPLPVVVGKLPGCRPIKIGRVADVRVTRSPTSTLRVNDKFCLEGVRRFLLIFLTTQVHRYRCCHRTGVKIRNRRITPRSRGSKCRQKNSVSPALLRRMVPSSFPMSVSRRRSWALHPTAHLQVGEGHEAF